MAFVPGKLTVATANPSVSVNLPIHSNEDPPKAPGSGAIFWDPNKKKIYLYAPNDDGYNVWQETQRQ